MIRLTDIKEAYCCMIGYDPFYDEYVLVVPIHAGHYDWSVFYAVPKDYYDQATPENEFLHKLSDAVFAGDVMGLASYELKYLGSTSDAARIPDPERWNDPRYETI